MSKRDYGIDLLKAISILGVLIIHTCAYDYRIPSFFWYSSVFWGSISRASVPIFLMCSGALFLSPDRPVSLKKLFTKNIPRIIAAMIVWGMAYKVFHLLANRDLTLSTLVHAFKQVLLFNQEFHFYYLQIILLVYLFLPITSMIVRNASRRQLEYALLLWFALAIVYPSVSGLWPFRMLDMMAPQYQINMTYASIGYGVLGFYIKRYPPKRRSMGTAIFIAGFAIILCGTAWMSVRIGSLYTRFFEGMTVGVVCMAAGLFALCVAAPHPRNTQVEHAVTYLSKASFCVFLTHVFFNYILPSMGFSIKLFSPIIGIPLVACITLMLSLVVYFLLSHIPVVKTWLV